MKTSDIEKRELKKHIAAIRVSNTVGALGRKLWNILLLNAYDDLLEKETHAIPVSVLSDVAGYNSNSYESLEFALKQLQTTLVEWDIGGGCEVKGKWSRNHISSQMLGSYNVNDGMIEYYYPKHLPQLLYNPDIYQRISLSQQKEISGSAALALWENCLRFVGVGSTGLSDVDEWRELLGVLNKKNYSVFFRFNDKIIKPAIKEVNEKTNITIALITEKRGRKIIKIGFSVKEKTDRALFSERLEDLKETTEYQELIQAGIHKVQALEWLDKHETKYIREKLDLLKKNEALGTLKNPAGFLVRSIEEDFTNPDTAKEAAKKHKAEEAREKLLAERREKQEAEQRRTAERAVKNAFLSSFSESEKETLLRQMKEDKPESSNFINDLGKGAGFSFLTLYIKDYQNKVEASIQENLKN